MEPVTVRLEGAPDVTNEVVHVFKDAIVAAVVDAGAGSNSDDSVEVVAGGKRRLVNGGAGPSAPKKQKQGRRDVALPVLEYNLTFAPPNDSKTLTAALGKLLEKDGSTRIAPVYLAAARDNAKTPHRLYLRLRSTNAALVEFNPIDSAASAITSSWIQMISPPPLTAAGKPFKPRARHLAARAPQRPAQAVAPTGGGGLLDAVAFLADFAAEGVKLDVSLSAELAHADEGSSKPSLLFRLEVAVSIKPSDFYSSTFSRSKRLLIDRLIPSSPVVDAPREAGIDFFYSSLQRAPRTADGLPVRSTHATPTPSTPAETDEERVTRLRREAKGKQRAVTPLPLDEQPQAKLAFEGPEDEPFYPPGLEAVTLMPFQARTVRWMLAREGKVILPRKRPDDEGEEEDEMNLDNAPPRASSSGGGGGGGSEEDERAAPVLGDVDAETLSEMRRGPLWEKVKLQVLPGREGAEQGEGEKTHIWLNRVSLELSVVDPLDVVQPVPIDVEEIVKEEGDDDDDVEVVSGSSRKGKETAKEDGAEAAEEEIVSSKDVIGGFEGHGLLGEEVGLGKTLEVLSLILLHQDPKRRKLPSFFNRVTDSEVQPSGISLIVAPTAIVGQWQNEIERLTPGLKVLRYEGIKSLKESWTSSYIAKRFNIVLTTYDILRREVAISRKPVQRGLRNKREVRYRRSLLVELDFLRIVMDEAQMVGDAGALETASLVSRRFSWAVTSTPLKDKISDLRPLLSFLRVEPIASGKSSLQRLLEETGSFKRLFGEIGARTLKSQITHELTLPAQVRYIVPVDLTAIERYYYDLNVSECLEAIGLDAQGAPADVRVDPETGAVLPFLPDKSQMNYWLTILRQLAVHPQLPGGRNKDRLGRGKVKTIEDVLTAMKDQAVSAVQSDQRALLAARVKRAQLGMWVTEEENRFEPALALFVNVVEELEPVIQEVTKEIHATWRNRKKTERSPSADPSDTGLAGALELGYRAEQQDDGQALNESERATKRQVGTLKTRLRELLFVKHSALFFSGHANYNLKREEEESKFYSEAEALRTQILKPYENAVERAQAILKTQLQTRENTDGALIIDDFEMEFDSQGRGLRAFAVFDDIENTSDVANGYAELILSYRQSILDMIFTSVSIAGEDATGEEYNDRAELQEKLTIYLEAYTILCSEWQYIVNGTRTALGDAFKAAQLGVLLRQEVLPQGAPPPKGVERDDPVEDVDEALQGALNAIGGPSRRRNEEDSEDLELDAEDMDDPEDDGYGEIVKKKKPAPKGKGKGKKKEKEKKDKTRYQAGRSANKKNNSYKDFIPPSLEAGNSATDLLRYELLVERIEAKGEGREFYEGKPIRHLLQALKTAMQGLEDVKDKEELGILNREHKRLKLAVEPLEKVGDRLRIEVNQLDKAFNARVQYYAQLQAVSDEVADPDVGGPKWKGMETEIAALLDEELALQEAIASKSTRRRYLDNLDAPNEEEQSGECPICINYFTAGVLTQCGHLTCSDCFSRWNAGHDSCALCKTPLPSSGHWTKVHYRPQAVEPVVAEQPKKASNQQALPKEIQDDIASLTPKLSTLDDGELDRIRDVQTSAPLSSKVNRIVQHIKLICGRDPEAKIVVFSAWREALELLMESCSRNGVGYVRLEGANGKGKKEGVVQRFAEDPDVAAFFLHTRSQSAGLNLICARYVFLVEPLLHPSLELQAVARIHRIGQRFQTTVMQYVVSSTADERVAELRARQGTSLFLSESAHSSSEAAFEQGKAEIRRAAGTADGDDQIEEDELARVLLEPAAFVNLQKSLLRFAPRPDIEPAGDEPVVEAYEDAAMVDAGGAGAGPVEA